MKEIIFSKYSNERSRSFAIRTDIVEEDGKRWLEKKWLYPEGKEHVLRMKKWNQKLDQMYGEVPPGIGTSPKTFLNSSVIVNGFLL